MAEIKESAAAKPKMQRHRSPNYPIIDLDTAINRIEVLRKQAQRHFVPLKTAYQLWDYTPKSAFGNQAIAALRAYGLIDIQGKGDARQIRVSDRGYRILLNDTEAEKLLKEAAIAPKLHAELLRKYGGGDGLPSSMVLRNYLLLERDFNEKSVDAFIRQFQRTLNYAKLTVTDSDSGEEEPANGKEEVLEEGTQMQKPDIMFERVVDGKKQTIIVESKNFPLYLTNQQQGLLRVPAKMTSLDYELLKKQIEHSLSVIDVTSVSVVSDYEKVLAALKAGLSSEEYSQINASQFEQDEQGISYRMSGPNTVLDKVRTILQDIGIKKGNKKG